MKRILLVALIIMVAGGAVAEDTFGLWRLMDGEYVNYLPLEEFTSPFTLYITIHDPSVFSVGGYEVGIDILDEMLILAATGPNGWTNFGDGTNQLVGFQTPLIIQGDLGVLGELQCLGLQFPQESRHITYHAADPASIPGHDGPVIANGVDPDDLIACGYVNGSPDVFFIAWVDATRSQSWTGVKALFD